MSKLLIHYRAHFEVDCEGDLEIQILDCDNYTYLSLAQARDLRDYLNNTLKKFDEKEVGDEQVSSIKCDRYN